MKTPNGFVGFLIITALGLCMGKEGFGEDIKYERMERSLSNDSTVYTVTSILSPPYLAVKSHIEHLRVKGNEQFGGYIKDVLERLRVHEGIQYKLQIVKDGRYGSLGSDGNWTGMIGEVVNGDADFAAAPLTVTDGRHKVVDFSKPFQVVGPVILLLKAGVAGAFDITEQVFRLLSPLDYGVWLLILLSIVVVSFCLFLIAYLNPYEWRRLADAGGATDREGENFVFLNCLWFVFSTLMWQGFHSSPRSVAGRTLAAFWWFVVILTLIMYTASVTRQFLAGHPNSPDETLASIKDAEDLVKQNKISYGTVRGGTTQAFFQHSDIPAIKKMWEKMSSSEEEVMTKTVRYGVQKVRESGGRYAYILENTMAEYFINKDPCDLRIAGGQLFQRGHAFAFKKGSPLTERVNHGFRVMQQNGELMQIERRWFKGPCIQDNAPVAGPGIKYQPVRAVDYAAAMIILALGIVLSFVIMIIEIIVYKASGQKQSWSP